MKSVFVVVGTMLTLVVIWLIYDQARNRSCEAVFEQSAPSLHANLAFLETKGDIALGRTQVNALSDGAAKMGLQLKACCLSHEQHLISDSQYGACLGRAQSYDTAINDVKKNVEQAGKASHDPDRMRQYSKQAQDSARVAIVAVESSPPMVTVAPPPATIAPPEMSQAAPTPHRGVPTADAAIGGGPAPADAEAPTQVHEDAPRGPDRSATGDAGHDAAER